MRHIPTRRILRISSFVALVAGLAISSHAIASTPAEKGPSEVAEAEQQPEADEEVDYPAAIEDFEEFVREHQEEGVEPEDAHDYTHDGAEHMADAMREVLPDEDGLFEDQPEQHEALEERLDAWENRLDEIADEHAAYSHLTRGLLEDGTEWLADLQQQTAPGAEAQIDQMRTAVENIDPQLDITEQVDQVQNYYDASVDTIKEIYTAQQEEDPLAGMTVELAVVAGEPIADNDDGLFEFNDENDVPAAIEDYNEFVREHREEGIDHVADYTREGTQHFHDALEEFVEADEELLEQRLDEMQEHVDLLDDTPRAQYPTQLVDTFQQGAQIMMVIQQNYYPQPEYEEQVANTFEAIDRIDTNQAIEGQVDTIENAFAQSANSLETMALAADEVPPEQPDPEVHGDERVVPVDDYDEPRMQQPGVEQPDDPEAELTEEVQNYIDFADEHDAQDFTGEEGEQNVTTGMRNLEEALGTFVDEQPADPMEPEPTAGEHQDEPGVEPEIDPEQPEVDEMGQMHEQLRENIDQLEQHVGEEEFTEHMSESMESAAELLTNIQQEEFPQLQQQAQQVQDAAEQIDADVELDEQNDQVAEYFDTAGDALEQMDQEREDPVVLLAGGDGIAGDYGDDPGMEQPGVEQPDDPEAELTEEVQNYVDFVDEHDAQDFTGEEGKQNVTTGMRNLEEALGTFVDEMPADDPLQPEQPDEPMDDPMEPGPTAGEHQGEPGQADPQQPGVEQPNDDQMGQMHEQLRENIDQLEQHVIDEEFIEMMNESMESAAELLTNIQQEEFPQLQQQAQQVQDAAEQIDPEVGLDEQNDQVAEYFDAAGDALEQMDQQREEEPITQLLGVKF